MVRVSADKILNRLTVILKGKFRSSEGEQIIQKIEHEVSQLNPGFSVITNFSELEDFDAVTPEMMQHFVDFLKGKGVSRIIRVVGGSKKGLLKFHKATGNQENYRVQYVATMADALKELKLFDVMNR